MAHLRLYEPTSHNSLDCAPCRCDDCEHLMSWHTFVEFNHARCGVPGCPCYTSETCSHIAMTGELTSRDEYLRDLGIEG